ncbi:hypothetical protein [Helicobacter pylori]|uniref:hypothetical protein n=1 Tax=Helicobacter pylori TaxID=210 RepID=UPI0015D7DDDB|nr:hypothetical protein [Helicobacter pylori]
MNTKGVVGDISNDERPNHASDTRIKRRSITLTHKAELKPLTREPKKSVFRARVKEIFNP